VVRSLGPYECYHHAPFIYTKDNFRQVCACVYETHCSTLHHIATYCITLQHTATHCNTLQHTATRCNTHVSVLFIAKIISDTFARVLQCGAVCCSVLQCGAVWCSLVQSGAVLCSAVQCFAVRCSALQRYGGIPLNKYQRPFPTKLYVCVCGCVCLLHVDIQH